jgi:PQQ-dependent catabolism-associated CXXCW motif protein
MARRLLAAAIALAIAATPVYSAGSGGLPEGVDPATGFRMDRYRAPVPHVLPGGTVADFAAAKAARADGRTVFVDVYPIRGENRVKPDGSWIVAEPRLRIPGAVWLPNVGLGALDGATEAWFRDMLVSLTGGDPGRPLLFYCAADCWHSWNAARRAILMGYSAVSWYPDGSEGWTENGETLEPAEPVAFVPAAGP